MVKRTCVLCLLGLFILTLIFQSGISADIASNSFAGGLYFSLIIQNDGTVGALGLNTSGQLGNGTTIDSPDSQVKVIGLTNIKAVAAGYNHSLALKADGTVSAWGDNFNGQLGDGTNNNIHTMPVPVSNLNGVIAIAAGEKHSLALKSDGTVWAWGSNDNGQLGDGTWGSHLTPVRVINLENIIAISTSGSHNLALKNDGTVWSWGLNSAGQLGDGTINDRNYPIQVAGLSDIRAIAAGTTHSLVLKYDSTVWAWGGNDDGQVGDGTKGNCRYTPVNVVGLTSVTAIDAGWVHSLALKDDGTVWAWGNNSFCQLGDWLLDNQRTPIQVNELNDIIAIASGERHGLALRNDGVTWGWGTFANSADPPTPLLKATSAKLTGLTLSAGALNPSFSSTTFTYSANVGYDSHTITVTATAEDSRATIIVNGEPAVSGRPSAPISLNVGSNTVTVEVIPFIGVPQNYTITATRASSPYLAGLVLRTGRAVLSLEPSFIRTTFNYHSNLNGTTTSVTVIPTAEDSNAIIKVNNIVVPGGQPSPPIILNIGDNTVVVSISSQTGLDQKTYIIVITRPG